MSKGPWVEVEIGWLEAPGPYLLVRPPGAEDPHLEPYVMSGGQLSEAQMQDLHLRDEYGPVLMGAGESCTSVAVPVRDVQPDLRQVRLVGCYTAQGDLAALRLEFTGGFQVPESWERVVEELRQEGALTVEEWEAREALKLRMN